MRESDRKRAPAELQRRSRGPDPRYPAPTPRSRSGGAGCCGSSRRRESPASRSRAATTASRTSGSEAASYSSAATQDRRAAACRRPVWRSTAATDLRCRAASPRPGPASRAGPDQPVGDRFARPPSPARPAPARGRGAAPASGRCRETRAHWPTVTFDDRADIGIVQPVCGSSAISRKMRSSSCSIECRSAWMTGSPPSTFRAAARGPDTNGSARRSPRPAAIRQRSRVDADVGTDGAQLVEEAMMR